MGINIIKEEIKIIIETLGEQYAVINQQSGKIPQIELDIVMSYTRKLYERLYDLNKLNSADAKSILEEIPEMILETETKPEVIVETEPIAEPIIEPVMETVMEPVIETVPEPVAEPAVEVVEAVAEPIIEVAEPLIEEKKIEIVFAEKEIIPEPIEEVKEAPVEIVAPKVDLEKTKEIIFDLQEVSTPEVTEEKKEPPVAEVKPTKTSKKDSVDLFSLTEKEIVADKFKETQKSMNDKIASEKPDKTLADKIGKTSIANLKTAIGINDKFLFINELFKGDIQEYNKTIDKLNSYTQLEECTGFLEEQKARYHWADKPDAYHKLEDLLIRKFL